MSAQHPAMSVGGLELVMAGHWQAPEQDWLGGWLLRAAGGFTNRANSVLAVGEPGMPMPNAVLEVSDWYADRGLRPVAASPEPRRAEDDTEQLLAATGAFEAAGWQRIEDGGALVLTAAIEQLRAPQLPGSGLSGSGARLQLDDRPDAEWLGQYRYRGGRAPESALALLLSAPEQVFVSVRDGERALAVARGSLAAGWAGLSCVTVDPAARRQGLAGAMLQAVAGWARQRGAGSCFVQVAESNQGAQRLYLGSGFEQHHGYAYLTPPR